MKKIIALFAIAFTLSASAQKTLPKDSLTADTKILSINDLLRLAEPLKDKVTAKQYETYTLILNEILKEAVDEWQKSHKK